MTHIKHWWISMFAVKRFSMIVAEDVWYERLIHFWTFFFFFLTNWKKWKVLSALSITTTNQLSSLISFFILLVHQLSPN